MTDKYAEALEKLSRPFIQAGLYESQDGFLLDLIKDLAQRKIEGYRNRIGHYERNHQSLAKFNAAIQDTATPEQEDAAWDWEDSIDYLASWQKKAKELGIDSL